MYFGGVFWPWHICLFTFQRGGLNGGSEPGKIGAAYKKKKKTETTDNTIVQHLIIIININKY